jgi:hypothetical protein
MRQLAYLRCLLIQRTNSKLQGGTQLVPEFIRECSQQNLFCEDRTGNKFPRVLFNSNFGDANRYSESQLPKQAPRKLVN